MKKGLMLLIWVGLMGCQPSKVTIPDNVIDLAKEEAKFRFYNGILLYHNKPFSGYLVVHFPSKKIFTKEGYWQGKAEGVHQKWYENGQLAERRTYHKNHKNGLHRGWWPNGTPKFNYHFLKDVATGTHHEWFENGQMYSLSTYNSEGQPEGKQQMWYMDGQLKANYVIQNGRRFGLLGAKGCMGDNERDVTSIKI